MTRLTSSKLLTRSFRGASFVLPNFVTECRSVPNFTTAISTLRAGKVIIKGRNRYREECQTFSPLHFESMYLYWKKE